MRKIVFMILAIGIIGTVAAIYTLSGSKPTRIVLITLDTLRYDSMMGGKDQPTTMPLSRAVGDKGLIFTRFYTATSTTQPTHATKFTAMHPWQHGVSRNGQVLDVKHTTVAEILKKNGFTTSAVVASFPVTSKVSQFDQGFDRYDETFTEGRKESKYALADQITKSIMRQLDTAEGDKQFFWFHYYDPHAPYGDTSGQFRGFTPKPQLERAVQRGESRKQLNEMVAKFRQYYDMDVKYMDQHLHQVLQRLEVESRKYDTHLIITSDHGESFGEDGSVAHGKRITHWQIHVPAFIISPRITPGMRDDVAGSIDIMPTILDLANVQHDTPGARSLLQKPKQPTPAFGMRRTFEIPFEETRLDGKVHIHDYDLFFIVYPDGRIFRGNRKQLLDLPQQDNAIAKTLPNALKRQFSKFEDELNGQPPTREIDLAVIEELKKLGYTQ